MSAHVCRHLTKQEREFINKRITDYLVKNKDLVENGGITVRQLADRFGVKTQRIHDIAMKLAIKVQNFDAISLSRDPRFKVTKDKQKEWGFTGRTIWKK